MTSAHTMIGVMSLSIEGFEQEFVCEISYERIPASRGEGPEPEYCSVFDVRCQRINWSNERQCTIGDGDPIDFTFILSQHQKDRLGELALAHYQGQRVPEPVREEV